MTCQCDDNSDPCASMGNTGVNLKQVPPCQSTLLTPQAEADIRAEVRLRKASFNLGGLIVGGTATAVIAANSMFRAFIIQDLVATMTNMDDVEITVHTYAVAKPLIDVFGGRFDRGNASPCTTGCGIAACGGPLDAFTITVTNISGAALGATDALTLQYRIAYPGEADYANACGGCSTGTATQQVAVQKVEP